jgi:membrane protease YdiL (CAAX protease family)
MPWDFWLIFLFLGLVIPWRGRARLQRLLARPAIDTLDKLILYGSTIAFQWVALGVVAWRALARGLTPAQLGLAHHSTARIAVAGLLGASLLGTFQWFNLRRIGRMTGPTPELMRKLAERILPTKPVELLPYCGLAVTAGVCEEFLYRGFAMAVLQRAGLPTALVVILTAAFFGLAHAYQGRSGVVATALMGILFGIGRLVFDSLAPMMVWHAGLDIVAGIAGPKFLLQTRATADK